MSKIKKSREIAKTTLKRIGDTCKKALERAAAPKYIGLAIIQAPGAWTRIGPTWFDDEMG